MIEVFKTDINDPSRASTIIAMIHESFSGYKANFDLDDCDRILRVQSVNESIEVNTLLTVLKEIGCNAEVLPDN